MSDELNGAAPLVRQGRKLDGFMEALYDRERRLEDAIRRAVDATHVLVIHVGGGDVLHVSLTVDKGGHRFERAFDCPSLFDDDRVAKTAMFYVGRHFANYGEPATAGVVDLPDPE